uniref:EMAP like 3 n=1 Tax=Nothobranchius furzeri TaxID=105023 RepID=A0A8C6VXT4_NOTFU
MNSGPGLFPDDVSADSCADYPDRASAMEVRLQAQEDEITLLKSSLADALRRIHVHDQLLPLLKQQLIHKPSLRQHPLPSGFTTHLGFRQNQRKTIRKTIRELACNGHVPTTTCRNLLVCVWSTPRQNACALFPPSGLVKKALLFHWCYIYGMFPNSLVCYCCLYVPGQSIKMFIRGRPITMYVPSNIHNYEDLKMELPSERLVLDWVYGYRGRDCRDNLFFLPTGEAVYFIACVIVLYHINKRTQRHYLKHTDCVRCLTLHPDKVRVASGQTAGMDKDGKPLQSCVHIWDSNTLVTLQQIGLGTFQRGVGSLAFSFADSGAFLSVIDDSNEHMLSVWDCTKGTKQAEIKSTNEAVFAVGFSPTDSNIIVTCGKSHVYFWTLSAGQFTKKQGIFGKYKKPKFIQCFVFGLTGDVLTGDSEGNILTWGKSAADVKTLGKGAKETFQIMRQTRAHEGSVFTLCSLQGGALLSGGGKDRKIIRWSADLAPETECEVNYTLVDEGEFLVGTTRNAILRGTFSDGFVAIVQSFSTHNSEIRHTWARHMTRIGDCDLLTRSCPLHPDRWVVLDLLTKEVLSDSTDGNEQLSVMRYSPDGSFLAVGSHDNFIYIYSVTESGRCYSRLGKCNGHSSFITHLDWSKDGKYIMSNSGDYEILYWEIGDGCKLLRNRFESKDREWASYTCVLGFHVMGVWLEGSDGTDINALCRSHSERVVAVADDFCKVHLFQYPCPKLKAPSHKYEGHGSHVTNVRFTHNDSHLLSMGGKDTCILQWRVVRGGAGSSRERLPSASSTSTSSPEPAAS